MLTKRKLIKYHVTFTLQNPHTFKAFYVNNRLLQAWEL
jgi:hypothetical protein